MAWKPLIGISATVVVAFGLLVLSVAALPQRLVDERGLTPAERVKAENDARSAVLQAIGGVALLGGLAYTAQSFRANRSTQIADRFTKSVGQLGEEETAVRIGALASLESIAAESRWDYSRVVETVVAFIRASAGQPRDVAPPDVVAALRVLSRRVGADREGHALQLDHMHMRAFRLTDGDFRWVNFVYSDLTRASLVNMDMRDANLAFSTFDFGFLTHSDCRGVNFGGTSLRGTYFLNTDLRDAEFRDADLAGADFSDRTDGAGRVRTAAPKLDGANLADANLTGTDFCGADLSKVEGLRPQQVASAVSDERTRWPTALRSTT